MLLAKIEAAAANTPMCLRPLRPIAGRHLQPVVANLRHPPLPALAAFRSLIACIVVMAELPLLRAPERAQPPQLTGSLNTPIDRALHHVSENITFDLARRLRRLHHCDRTALVALPAEPTAPRPRAAWSTYVADQRALPGSAHPLQSGAAVADVFLVALPVTGHAVDSSGPGAPASTAAPRPLTIPVRSTDGPTLCNLIEAWRRNWPSSTLRQQLRQRPSVGESRWSR